LKGPGRFPWNSAGRFGSQLGGTLWLLVGALARVPHAPDDAAVWLACFAVANAIGIGLWTRRNRIWPYPALQALQLVCGGSGLVALIARHVLRPGLRITRPTGNYLADEPRLMLWLLILVAPMMPWSHFGEWGARKGLREPIS
jgi:hypothetical protein